MDNNQMLIVVGVAAGAFLLGGILFPPSWKDRAIGVLKWLLMPRGGKQKQAKETDSGAAWWEKNDGHQPERVLTGDEYLAEAIAEIRRRGGKVEPPEPEPAEVSEKDKAIEYLRKHGYQVEKPDRRKRVRNRKKTVKA